jgi:hypothetical protein
VHGWITQTTANDKIEQIWEYLDICPCLLNLMLINEVICHMYRVCTSILRKQVNKQTSLHVHSISFQFMYDCQLFIIVWSKILYEDTFN